MLKSVFEVSWFRGKALAGLRLASGCLALLAAGPLAAAEVPTLTEVWSVRIGRTTDCSPAIGPDGTIYFGTFSGSLWAIQADGREKWVFRTGHGGLISVEIRSSPAVAEDGTIYFGCRDRRFYALNPNGRKKWDFATGGWVDSSPAIGADGTVYFGSWDRNFYALNPDGTKKWEFATSGEITSSPAVDAAGRIYFGSHDGKFYALRADGSKAWEHATGGAILASPAIDADGAIYFTSLDGHLYALESEGNLRWKLRTGGITESSPVIGLEGTVYVGVNKNLWAVDRQGRKLWEQPATLDAYQEPISATPVALADGSLIVVSHYGLLTAFDQERKMRWKYYLYGYDHGSPVVAEDGTILVCRQVPNVGHAMVALSNRVPLAPSPWPKFRGNLRGDGRQRPPR